ncbi:MAG: phosphoglycerate dehydrogenase [Deferribacteraceae bacterium]|jgi:D-3-phosphoglycerate dehydrogenase|nr:phosphoglycerate dehydrogenase [Deferribacteraceae bacterium]
MAKFNVIVTDHLAEEGYDILRADPEVELDLRPGIKNDELKKILGNYDAVITRSGTDVDEDLLSDTGKLKIVGRAGVGLDNVDIETASRKGLIVMNAPTGNTIAAVELSMGMILAAARKIPAADTSLRAGEWDRKRFMGVQLHNKVLGIVGLGRIGGNVAARCKAFGMKVHVYDPYIKRERAEGLGVKLCQSLEELLSIADVLTLHTPLTNETKKMIGREQIALMKDGAILVNCARGGLMDEQAVVDAVNSGKLFSAATDVFEEEPPTGSPLTKTENLFVTPHIGANTEEGQKGVAVIICEQVLNALHGRPYQYAVNKPFEKEQLSSDMQKFFDVSESLGRMAAQLTIGKVQEVRVIMAGKRFEEDLGEKSFDTPFNFQPFTIALAKGFMETYLHNPVSYINAPYLAQDRGMMLNETKTDEYSRSRLRDHIIVIVKTDLGEVRYAATVFADGVGRIVRIADFHLDLIAKGIYLYFKNHDTPGIVGKVGTLLGEHGVNIVNFALTRLHSRGSEAVSFVLVDEPIPQIVIDKLYQFEGIIEAKAIKL